MADDNETLPPDDEDEGQDAGLLDNEGGDEAADEAAEAGGDEAQEGLDAKPSRATRAVQAAKQAAREANERAARVEQELQALRSERDRQRQQPQEETEEQFNSRLSLMTVEERIDAKLQRAERRHQRELAVATFRTADAADKASYDAQSAYDPRFKKYSVEVEQALQQARSMGNYSLDRRTVLAYVIGQKVLGNKEQVDKARQQGQRNIQRQQSRTTGGRSDQPPRERRKTYAADDMSLEAVESRLNGVFI